MTKLKCPIYTNASLMYSKRQMFRRHRSPQAYSQEEAVLGCNVLHARHIQSLPFYWPISTENKKHTKNTKQNRTEKKMMDRKTHEKPLWTHIACDCVYFSLTIDNSSTLNTNKHHKTRMHTLTATLAIHTEKNGLTREKHICMQNTL